MIKGVTRPDEAARLGLSNRLLARLGALLKKKLALSPAVLESATPGSKLETLLLRPEVLQDAATLNAETLDALLKTSGVEMLFALGDQDDGIRVLCLQEELEADDAWIVTAPPANPLAARTTDALVSKVSTPDSNASNAVFSDDHLTRTKLKFATAASAAERIEALRVIVYAPLTPGEKAEALLQGLADPDPLVRAEAAVLLPALGVSSDVSSALADLNRSDSARQLAAADKLDKLSASSANEFEEGAVIVCAMSALKADGPREMKARLLGLLARRAPTLGRNPARLSELIRAVMSMLATAAKHGSSSRELEELASPAGKLVRELARLYPDSMRPLILSERERAPDFVTEAFALNALFELIPQGHEAEAALLNVSAEYLSRDIDEGRESRSVGALMTRRGSAALEKLCAVFPRSTEGAKKHILILLDEMCRKADANERDFVLASQTLLEAMDDGSKSLRMAAMECRLASDNRVPPETRTQLAGVFLESTGDFSFPFDIEKVESAVARMGDPAVAPLLKRLSTDRAANERTRAARLLGELALNSRAEPGRMKELQSQLTEALRRLEAASLEQNFPEPGEVFSALGKVVSSPAASIEAGAVVTRSLLEGARAGIAGALEGLSYLASARRATPEIIAEAAKMLREALDAPEPEKLESNSVTEHGENVYEIEGGERYAVALPAALRGLERVALAPNATATLAREIGARLLERWQELCAGKRVWGPLNTHLVVGALRAIALSARCSEELRVEIIRGLYLRHSQTPVMHALADIFSEHNSPRLSSMALSFGYTMLSRRDNEARFDHVDRPEILAALSRIAGLKLLSAQPNQSERTPDAFRRTVMTELIKAAKDRVPGTEQMLLKLKESGALPQELSDEIARWSSRFSVMKR